MKMNTLSKLLHCLKAESPQIEMHDNDITGQTTHRENAPMELALFSAFLHPEYFNPKKLFQSTSNARGE